MYIKAVLKKELFVGKFAFLNGWGVASVKNNVGHAGLMHYWTGSFCLESVECIGLGAGWES